MRSCQTCQMPVAGRRAAHHCSIKVFKRARDPPFTAIEYRTEKYCFTTSLSCKLDIMGLFLGGGHGSSSPYWLDRVHRGSMVAYVLHSTRQRRPCTKSFRICALHVNLRNNQVRQSILGPKTCQCGSNGTKLMFMQNSLAPKFASELPSGS